MTTWGRYRRPSQHEVRSLSRILITGASGYLGSRLADLLRNDPETELRALGRRHAAYLPIADQRSVALPGDPSELADACAEVDVVVHLAGANEVIAAEEPDRALSDTILGTRRLAAAAAGAGVRRFVYLSTVHVYGSPAEGAVLAEERAPAPRAAYAIARLASEHVAAAAAAAAAAVGGSLDVVVLRLTNSVGAPADPSVDRWTLAANDLCRQAVMHGVLRLRSDGLQWRDFIPMRDACRIIGAALRTAPVEAGTYNLGSGDPMTVRQMAGLVQDAAESLTGRRPPLEAPEARRHPPKPHYVAVERLAALGLHAEGTVQSAVEETFRFCLEHKDRL